MITCPLLPATATCAFQARCRPNAGRFTSVASGSVVLWSVRFGRLGQSFPLPRRPGAGVSDGGSGSSGGTSGAGSFSAYSRYTYSETERGGAACSSLVTNESTEAAAWISVLSTYTGPSVRSPASRHSSIERLKNDSKTSAGRRARSFESTLWSGVGSSRS